jgi:membrane associated rhomboid family serine protease
MGSRREPLTGAGLAFIPVHDGKPLTHISRPWVTWSLIAVNVLVYFFVEGGGIEGDVSRASMISYGLIPAVFNDYLSLPAEFTELPDAFTLVTYAFLHGDLWHLVGNMVFLWVFGDNVEDAMGHARYIAFYILCAIGAGYAFVLSDPASESPVLGASGAIAGIVAAYFLLHPFQKVWVLALGRIPLRLNALWILGAWILFQIYGLVFAAPDEIAWWTHVGGLITGAILVLVLRRRGVPLFDRGVQLLSLTPGARAGAAARGSVPTVSNRQPGDPAA